MNSCDVCGGRMSVYAVDRITGTETKARRRRCHECGNTSIEVVPLDHRLPPSTWKEARLTDAQVEWVLTTRHSGEHCRKVLGCSGSLLSRIRRRVIYRHVRPDLGRWYRHHPWLTDAPAPEGLTVAERRATQQVAARNCLDCEHYGGLSRLCLLGHAAVQTAGMKAAAECADYQEEEDDESELEAAS